MYVILFEKDLDGLRTKFIHMIENIDVFDWYRVFFGEFQLAYLLEIVFRTAFMFLLLLVLLRLFGKESVNQLTIVEFFIFLALSSAAGDPMFSSDIGLIWGGLAIFVIWLMYKAQSFITQRNEKAEDIIKGRPTLLIEEGCICGENLGKTALARDELLSLLRLKSIDSVGKVKLAYLERNGALSVFQYEEGKSKKGLPTLAERGIEKIKEFHKDDSVPEDSEYASFRNGKISTFRKGEKFPEGKWVKAI